MKYYLIVGEASGDLHASRLMRSLKKIDEFAALPSGTTTSLAALDSLLHASAVDNCLWQKKRNRQKEVSRKREMRRIRYVMRQPRKKTTFNRSHRN